jgi:hypothetical protein
MTIKENLAIETLNNIIFVSYTTNLITIIQLLMAPPNSCKPFHVHWMLIESIFLMFKNNKLELKTLTQPICNVDFLIHRPIIPISILVFTKCYSLEHKV